VARFKVDSGGGGLSTTPSFVAVGAASDAPGGLPLNPTYGANIAGDRFAIHLVAYGEEFLQPDGWTVRGFRADTDGFGTSLRHSIIFRDAPSVGGEAGAVNITVASGALLSSAVIYTFRNVTGIEAWSAVPATAAAAIAAPTVAAAGTHRLACAFYAGYGGPVAVIAGAVGGVWTEADEYDAGSTLFAELQIAPLDAGGTISGGTAGIGSASRWTNGIGLALVGV
jgi:hypothetical protein